MAPSWSNLLPELLVCIGETITVYEDFISFSGVCTSWQSAAETIGIENFTGVSRFPTLMLAEDDVNDGEEEASHNLRQIVFHPYNTRAIRRINLPECRKQRCLSSKGWIITLETDEGSPYLLHLVSRRQIQLPRLDTFPDFALENNRDKHFIRKFVISSSDPTSDDKDLVVMVLWGGTHKLGFCRPGLDTSWVADNVHMSFCDITYVNRMLYGITGKQVMACDVHGPDPTKLHPILHTGISIMDKWFYISGSGCSGNELLIVSRHGMWDGAWVDEWTEERTLVDPDPDYRCKTFEVFELSLKDVKLRKLENLGGKRSIFVGYNSSFCIDVSATNGSIKPDCVYFTDNLVECYMSCSKGGGGKDMGIYNLRNGEIERFLDGRESRSFLSPPLWVFDESAS